MSDAPFRVRPLLDHDNRFFWTSGRDGVLRFLRCADCGRWLHPPVPRCPDCGGADVAPQEVSGRGTVVSCTVNHHPWDGSTEPWSIAIVELVEHRDLRLTTNVVGCDPDDVAIDMAVQVAFEHHDDVWIPVFEPADGRAEEGAP
ncbi:Zn-ribbon domain-containing OB-fold protein [Dermatobacter hominis]|uniref:Zn-ribbon domain-containing OB-fold protein n=1 Tax=Dermatobacter hominis TaxID=2884263 RepID=UPI001D101072|nr:OB-fold domain-containing protein [Dermatobacter hominis]UDY35039.1 OB-fold domain-containing protein [Dermatobacter hominis]